MQYRVRICDVCDTPIKNHKWGTAYWGNDDYRVAVTVNRQESGYWRHIDVCRSCAKQMVTEFPEYDALPEKKEVVEVVHRKHQAMKQGPEAILDTPIRKAIDNDHAVWNRTRIHNALAFLEVDTYRDLYRHTEWDLLKVKNFGGSSLRELQTHLQSVGLSPLPKGTRPRGYLHLTPDTP